MYDLLIYIAQILSSIILLNFGVRIFKMTGGYKTTYGRFTYHMLIIGMCFTLLSITNTITYLFPLTAAVVYSMDVIYSLLLSYSFLIAGLELMSSYKKPQNENAIGHDNKTFRGHMKGIIPRHVNTFKRTCQ